MAPLRIAHIGCGGNQRWHISQVIDMPEFLITALVDPSEAQLKKTVETYPKLAEVPTFSDYRTMLDKVELDAVLISTPHTQHIHQMTDCFAKGLNVLCEKPLVTSVADAHLAIAARDKSGKVGAIAYQRHGVPVWGLVKHLVEAERYGRLQCINSHLGQGWLRGTKGSWRQDPALSGGGQLNDSGSHIIDVLLWSTGLKAQVVSAFIDNRGSEVDIDSAISVQFDRGVLGTVTIIGDAAQWNESHHLWFEDATMAIRHDQIFVQERKGKPYEIKPTEEPVGPVRNFADAILHGKKVLAPFECGLRVIEFTEAAWQSAGEGGKPVRVKVT